MRIQSKQPEGEQQTQKIWRNFNDRNFLFGQNPKERPLYVFEFNQIDWVSFYAVHRPQFPMLHCELFELSFVRWQAP